MRGITNIMARLAPASLRERLLLRKELDLLKEL